MKHINIQLKQSRGFTLLEALLGFLILSIGMLGIASLQAVSLKAGKTSVYGSVAMMKVEELFESMRANPSAIALAAYTTAGAGANNGCAGGATSCTPAALAVEDVFWWRTNLAAGLPGTVGTGIGTSIVLIPAVAPSNMATMTIAVTWSERSKDNIGSVNKGFTSVTNICTGVPC
ncbi:MAG: type IV pilus modification protein PilV [Gammaproteobacteria bacterium]|nr:MAG: type IV pilus modification protein PilV [Gammaproteobacteria bacterium]